jgi:hypothetical protein
MWPEREAHHPPPTRGQENVDLYIHSSVRPHGVALNYLSKSSTSTFLFLSTSVIHT